MIAALILNLLLTGSPGSELLDRMADRYSHADGIQWTMQSTVFSPVFREAENTLVEFYFNPPDTFYFESDKEEIIGVADTIWILSQRHRQIQKKLMEGFVMPARLIIDWDARYNLESLTKKDGYNEFQLKAHEGITPPDIALRIDKNDKIKSLYYKDSSGNDVTLTIKKEKLLRSKSINFFYVNIPSGYKLIDLTE